MAAAASTIAREAREKKWFFLAVLQGEITKKRLFLRFQIGKKWTFGRPGFWKYQNPDAVGRQTPPMQWERCSASVGASWLRYGLPCKGLGPPRN